MVPFPDSPVTPGRISDLEATRSGQVDPVRFVVQATLALYLSPVILVVCLIGGASVMAGGVAKLAARMGRDATHRKIGNRTLVAQASAGTVGPRRTTPQQRSHAAH